MVRLARVVLPGHRHHITQRAHRRQDVFFRDEDDENYLDLLKEWCEKEQIEIWAYGLMSHPVHLIVKPNKTSNLSQAIGETPRRYTRACALGVRPHWGSGLTFYILTAVCYFVAMGLLKASFICRFTLFKD
jgi:REP element-mobilizing transposase RayT